MRTWGTLVLVLLICIGVAGFSRGWFTLTSHERGPEGNKVDVNLTMDKDKMKDDAERVKEKTKELGNRARDKVRSEGE